MTVLLLALSCGGGSSDGGGRDDGADDDDGDDDAADDDTGDDDADDDATDDDTTVDIDWVTIPAGEFEMGCVPGDNECEDDESPQHHVVISTDFLMAATETTQAQYVTVMGEEEDFSVHEGCENCPAENFPWNKAEEFCLAIEARLPTEAEWEYAARAGTTAIYVCGDEEECLDAVAWTYENSDGETHPVGQKEPNAFGLYDTQGNVSEFISDWYDPDYYTSRPAPDVDPLGPTTGDYRGVRGGGYSNSGHWDLNDILRLSARPYISVGPHRDDVGVRCVKDISL